MTKTKSGGSGVRSAKCGVLRRIALRTSQFALAVVGLSGCTDWAGYDLDYLWDKIPALSTMRGSVAYDPYELPRLPAPNSVPVAVPNGDSPAPFPQSQLDSVAGTLTNPYAGNASPAVLARGQAMYGQHCFACHGPEGAGNGPVVGQGKYPFAPAINVPATAARSDGYLYAVIAAGRGLMPPYGERITHLDRWATVSYLRRLQGQSGSAPPAVRGVPTVVNPPDTMPGGAPAVDTTGRQPQQ